MESQYKKVRITQHTHKPRIAHQTKPSAQYSTLHLYMYMYMSVSSVLNVLYTILAFL